MKRYRVAHVITRMCKGGAQENTLATVRLCDGERFEADLITGVVGPNESSLEEEASTAGVELIRQPHLTRNVSPLADYKALRGLTRLFRERQYHIVHTHTSKAGFVGRLAAARAKVPIVVHTPHGHIFDGYFARPVTELFLWMERYAARKTDRLIALTRRGIEEHIEKRIGTRPQWTAIHSGIDTALFADAGARRSETRAALGVDPGEVLVGGVGRLEPVKGFTYFVDAARQASASAPGLRFILAGDGSQRETLERRAAELGKRFHFLGLRADVPELMAAMDIFVLPSINEGMGRVLLECGAAGNPAVATAVGGVPEIVQDGQTGLLVPPRDSEALAAAIVELASDAAKRTELGKAARAHVVPDYDLASMVTQIEGLYAQLIEEKKIDL